MAIIFDRFSNIKQNQANLSALFNTDNIISVSGSSFALINLKMPKTMWELCSSEEELKY